MDSTLRRGSRMNGTPFSDEILNKGLRRLLRDVEISASTTRMGLEEAVVGETSLVNCGFETLYCGYLVSDLIDSCSFMEVAYLLLHGELPDEESLADFRSIMTENAWLDPMLSDWIESIPLHVPVMDVLRTCVSMISHFDPDLDPFTEQDSPELITIRAVRLLAQLPSLLALRVSRQQGHDVPEPDPELSFVANLFTGLVGHRPDEAEERVMNRLLILHACNSFDGPTVAARTASACRSDFYSAMLAAVSTVKGTEELGGVRQHLLALEEIACGGSVIEEVKVLLTQGPLDGFVREDEDRRGLLLTDDCRVMARSNQHRKLECAARGVEQMVYAASSRVPDLRWNSARILHYMGLDDEAFGPLLAIARIPGWAGHCREQMHSSERIRPLAQYVGPAARRLKRT